MRTSNFVWLVGISTNVVDVPTGGHRRRFMTENKLTAAPQQYKAAASTAGSDPTSAIPGIILALRPPRKPLLTAWTSAADAPQNIFRCSQLCIAVSPFRRRRDTALARVFIRTYNKGRS